MTVSKALATLTIGLSITNFVKAIPTENANQVSCSEHVHKKIESRLEVEKALVEILEKDGLDEEQIGVEVMRLRFTNAISNGGFSRIISKRLSELLYFKDKKQIKATLENFEMIRFSFRDWLISKVSEDILALLKLDPKHPEDKFKIHTFLGISEEEFTSVRKQMEKTSNPFENLKLLIRHLMVELPGQMLLEITNYCSIKTGRASPDEAFIPTHLLINGITSELHDLKEFEYFLEIEKAPLSDEVIKEIEKILRKHKDELVWVGRLLPQQGFATEINLRIFAKIVIESMIQASHSTGDRIKYQRSLFAALLLASMQLRQIATGQEKSFPMYTRDVPATTYFSGNSFKANKVEQVIAIANLAASRLKGRRESNELIVRKQRYQKALKFFTRELGYGTRKETDKMIKGIWTSLYGGPSLSP
ncbi:MAG: hypothetical protein AB7F43_10955 [Bacteriovoracia bacterium]